MLQNVPMCSYIPAKDVARASKFYEEKLGFKRTMDIEQGFQPSASGIRLMNNPTRNKFVFR